MRLKYFILPLATVFCASSAISQDGMSGKVQLWQGFYAGMNPEEVLEGVKSYKNVRRPKILKKPYVQKWADHANTNLYLVVDYSQDRTFTILDVPIYFRPYFTEKNVLETMVMNVSPKSGPCSDYSVNEFVDAFDFWKNAIKQKYNTEINGFDTEKKTDRKSIFTDGKVVVEVYMERIPPQVPQNEIEAIYKCQEIQYSIDLIYRSKEFYNKIVDEKNSQSRENVESFKKDSINEL